MKTTTTILQNIQKEKELSRNIQEGYWGENKEEQFIADAKAYVKAIKEGRMLCSIPSVSRSGMSRVINFMACVKSERRYYYRNFNTLFRALGYREVRREGFRISGCGMDMVFHTNYSNIHILSRLGFLTKTECDNLAQQTPTTI